MPKVEATAYCKIALHAVKFPHCAVRGLLIGRLEGSDMTVVDAIPVLHGILVAPPIEIALMATDEYCEEKKLRIIGSYFANQLVNDESIDIAWAKPLQDKLASTDIHSPLLIRVDNSKLSLNSSHSCLVGYNYDSGKWKHVNVDLVKSDATLNTYSTAVQNKMHRELVDFESHLDEPSADFFNVELGEKLLTIAN